MEIKAICANYKCRKPFTLSKGQLRNKKWGQQKFYHTARCSNIFKHIEIVEESIL